MNNGNMNGDPMDDWRFGFEVKSDQLGAAEVGNGATYTIDAVDFRKVGDGRDARLRPVVRVRESDLDWVTCKTTLFCLEAMFGRSPRGWLGKQVTLYWDPTVKFGKDTVGGVRVAGAPGLTPRTVTIKLPRKKDQKVRLVDTAPQPDPATARAKLLEAARDKHGTDEATIRAWLAEQGGTDLDAMTVDDLRGLFRVLSDIAAWAAEQTPDSADDGGEYVE